MLDQNSVHPVCTRLDGEYGLTDVSLSMPAVIGRGGIIRRMPPQLNSWELERLRESAQYILSTVENM